MVGGDGSAEKICAPVPERRSPPAQHMQLGRKTTDFLCTAHTRKKATTQNRTCQPRFWRVVIIVLRKIILIKIQGVES